MKKNMFQPEAKAEILARIDSLTPDAKNKWGKMNVRQGLRHMSFAFANAIGDHPVTVPKGGTIKKKLMKFFLLNIPVPKGKAETFPEFNTVNLGIDPPNFEAERTNLKTQIEKFVNATKLIPESAGGGPFSREDWGRLMYTHTDHHLREFGA
jgi:hypothetical protein